MVERGLQTGVAVAFGVCLFIALSTVARAETPTKTVRLMLVRGERTESCSDGAAMARNVSARLGRNVFDESAAESIEGIIQHDGGRWEARLYVRDAGGVLIGSRSLASESADCGALDAAVTLAIALAIDPDAALRSPPPVPVVAASPPPSNPLPRAVAPSPPPAIAAAPAVSCPPPPRPAPPCTQPTPGPPAASHSEPRLAALSARALVAPSGILPAPAGGLELAAEAFAGPVLGATAGMLFFPEVRTADQSVALGLTLASLGACARPWRTPAVDVELCAKVLVGAIHSVVYNRLTPVSPGDQPWAANSLAGSVRLRLVGPLFAEVGGEALVTWAQYSFSVTGQSPSSLSQSRFSGFGFVGLGLSIQ
jgi:hypothetical protein